MTAAIASLILGLIIGYLGQRSRLCFISGYRDFFMARDTTLLKGVLGAFIGALAGYVLFSAIGGVVPGFPMFLSTAGITAATWHFTIVGGLGVGIVGVLSGGCPFRMHVQAFEGKKTYAVYLLGFYIGLIFYDLVTAPGLQMLTRMLK